MNIDGVKNGIVIDHITAGKSMDIYELLELDKLDCTVAMIQNVDSDPRAKYFEQARCGKFIRMALILKLLGLDKEV